MPYRHWLLIVALGIAFLPAPSGQAQQEAESGQEGPAEQAEPTQALPIPLPVQVIEDDESAEARQRSEAEARQREIDDLAAQQGMNTAAQDMNDATQRMALYSLLSTALIGIGTALLIWTLFLTRQANEAARDAVKVTREMGIVQSRAYVGVVSAAIVRFDAGLPIEIVVTYKNSGMSPASRLRGKYVARWGRDEEASFISFGDGTNVKKSTDNLGSGSSGVIRHRTIAFNQEQLVAIAQGHARTSQGY